MGGGGCRATTGTGDPDNFPAAKFIGTHTSHSAEKI
jgi:hypothetical protein